MEELITLAEFTDLNRAYIIKGRLESEGIECFLHNENINNIIPMAHSAFGGIQLKVRLSDSLRAFDIFTALNPDSEDSAI